MVAVALFGQPFQGALHGLQLADFFGQFGGVAARQLFDFGAGTLRVVPQCQQAFDLPDRKPQ